MIQYFILIFLLFYLCIFIIWAMVMGNLVQINLIRNENFDLKLKYIFKQLQYKFKDYHGYKY